MTYIYPLRLSPELATAIWGKAKEDERPPLDLILDVLSAQYLEQGHS